MDLKKLLDDLIRDVEALQFEDEGKLDVIRRRGTMLIRNLGAEKQHYVDEVKGIWFYPSVYPCSREDKIEAWKSGQKQLVNLLSTIKEELTLFGASSTDTSGNTLSEQSTEVFVVHGHDEAMKEAVARTLNKLGLDPVILHEKPNKGRTIIEKFSDYSDVGFAVVLLSPDDVGYAKLDGEASKKNRARQNVILELGYFLGKLGRQRVVALHKIADDFEMPSDYSGVLFVPFDVGDKWQIELVRELKACGYNVDANRLL